MDVMIQQAEHEGQRALAGRSELVERIGRAMRVDGVVQPLPGLHLRPSTGFEGHSPLEPAVHTRL